MLENDGAGAAPVRRSVTAARVRPWALPAVAAAGAALAAAFAVYDFVLPLAPVRRSRPAGDLVPELWIWERADDWLPVPSSPRSIAVTILAAGGLAFAGYAVALVAAWRHGGAGLARIAFGGAVAFFCMSAFALPTFNSDIYDYIAFGRVSSEHGGDPYEDPPARYRDDPILPYASEGYTERPDNKLPAWAVINTALSSAAGDDPATAILVYRLAFLTINVANLSLVCAVLRATKPGLLAVGLVAYGWNPIVALQGQSKTDTIMTFFLLLGALLIVRRRSVLAAPALAASVLIKLMTLPFAAAWWLGEVRRRRYGPAVLGLALAALTALLVYAPFWGGFDLMLEHLGVARPDGPQGPAVVRPAYRSPVLTLVLGALVVVTAASLDGTPRRLFRGWALIALYVALALTPIGFSWYLMTLVALTAIAADWRIICATAVLSGSSFAFETWRRMSSRAHPLPEVPEASDVLLYAGPAVVVGTVLLVAALWLRTRRAAVSTT